MMSCEYLVVLSVMKTMIDFVLKQKQSWMRKLSSGIILAKRV